MKAVALSQFWPLLEQSVINTPNEVRRLFHGRGRCYDGLEQLTVDWLQGQLMVNLFKPVDNLFLETLKEGLIKFTNNTVWLNREGRSILLQHRYQDGTPLEVLFGEPDFNPIIEENTLKYRLELGKNQNSGLFLDMRLGRQWIQARAKQKNVLNLFAYTCGFSVAAMAGGAEQVVNVDIAKAMLNRGRENHRLNGHNTKQIKFLGHDILKSWGKIKKYGLYDLIIIDPPEFQKGSFAVSKDYKKILRRLPNLLAHNGEVLACVNSPRLTPDFLIELMQEEASEFKYQYRLENPPEFRDKDRNSSLKALVFS